MLGILCGLDSEEKIAATVPRAIVACAAAQPAKSRYLAQQMVDRGVKRLMSFGVAGALHPDLPVGALVIGRTVVSPEGRWLCDADWAGQLAQKTGGTLGEVWGSETLVAESAAKIGLNRDTGCVIVDMESQCAAEVAAAASIPLAVVRVVCDTATHEVPAFTLYATNPDGSINIGRVMSGIVRQPSLLPNLVSIGLSMSRALKELRRAAQAMA